MHQYGEEGLCLIWGVNNALQRKLLTKEAVMREISHINDLNTRRTIRHYIGRDGINFRAFKRVLKERYRIYLRKVKTYKMTGRYLVTYDFGDYYHTVALVDGEILDSRKENEIRSLDTDRRVVDVYRVAR
jgi:hypothetical protein